MREISSKPIEHAVVESSAGGCEIDPEDGGGVSSCMAAFMCVPSLQTPNLLPSVKPLTIG